MMTTKTFDEFVKEQVAHADELKSNNEVDWPERLHTWQGELNKLYSKIEKYLKKYIEAGNIKVHRDKITVTEPNVGSYEAEKLVLCFGNNEVIAEPIGTKLVGAKGRVDLIGRRGSIKVALLEKGGPAWEREVSFSKPIHESRRTSSLLSDIVDSEGWYIISPPPRITATPFDKRSFQDAIMELADV